MTEGARPDETAEEDGLYDPHFVKDVFDRCSGTYIAFSYLCSLGFTERWRRQCVELLDLPDADGATGYDLMAGTGEVWPHLLRHHPGIGAITAVDISTGMHKRALDRLHRHRAHRIAFIEDDVLKSALAPESADFVLSTFGLKTFNANQQARLAGLVAEVLKPGGRFAFIEASDPGGWWLRPLYLFHLKRVLPLVERVVLRGAQDFAMIGAYCTRFGDARTFGDQLRRHGLDVRDSRHFFGCATAVSGRKPDRASNLQPSGPGCRDGDPSPNHQGDDRNA
ncbi:MAG: class I SAM-dependent methyltransferase [Alphaproteobacteria bacterium]|nr:class I SAM-dependent methyltransferase [Alphaproteobacteria bacterium]